MEFIYDTSQTYNSAEKFGGSQMDFPLVSFYGISNIVGYYYSKPISIHINTSISNNSIYYEYAV